MRTRTRRFYTALLYHALLTLTALCLLTWLPTAAQAQISLTLAPASVTALPGDLGVSVFGTLTNAGADSVDLDNAYFNLISGPSGADLTSALFFSDYSAPFTLDAGQVYSGALFTLDTDPSAPLGEYLGNFSASYGGQSVGQDVTVNLAAPTPVPEASPLLLLGVGIAFILGMLYRRQQGLLVSQER